MKPHDCTQCEPWLEALLDGELAAGDRDRIEQELARCEPCRNRLAALTEMRTLLNQHIQDAVDAVDFTPLWQRLEPALVPRASSPDPIQLQAFADGELRGRELFALTEQINRSPGSLAQVEAIAEMGDLVRESMEHAARDLDFDALWHRLERAVGPELEARGTFQVTPVRERREPRASWFDRILAAIGGYRSILMSAATAALVALILVPILNRDQSVGPSPDLGPGVSQTAGTTVAQPQQLEIRVVHVNEVVSNPGHQVTVDSYDGYAPVIYIRSEEEREPQAPPDRQQAPEPYRGPI